jgi:hypothetical protein
MLALLIGGAAHSATVELEGNTAVAVNNLVVEGFDQPFNVTFCLGVSTECLAEDDAEVFESETVFAAADALNAALTDGQANSTGEAGGDQNLGLYAIPVAEFLGNVLWLGGAYVDNADPSLAAWTSEIAGSPFAGAASSTQPFSWAQFTVVPVPAAVWLFGSALGLLGWIRHSAFRR